VIAARQLPAYELRDKRIRIEAPSSSRDAIGGLVPGWTHFATVWAGIEDVSGREYVAAGATQNSALTRIGIDYRPGVRAAMRVVHDGATYNIEAVLGQDHRPLLLMCKRLA
jgi:SPP1 family predicted phage head-tail adaptor